ncbi:helix-turn-helix domain-containing protein [Sinanaerobacter sp. ZZT-01]|uniref:helix-turn-helix domain-containing protein n=1 Tax=Sinanaerobacter sp. ZZT-01 TaxID=3111540 RepID=UPI002D765F76|nr:helix-turn-helix domain-containing protein [Sinanaerobacter sp. ZZT-01]WRR92479.1 helix-turn-helix domain-containing protein [Sinanaerobacter sp. ZZT-01]
MKLDNILHSLENETVRAQFNQLDYPWIIISRDEYISLLQSKEKYEKFKKNQNGRKELCIDIKEILRLKENGVSIRQIAKRMGVTDTTIRSHLKRYANQQKAAPIIIKLK